MSELRFGPTHPYRLQLAATQAHPRMGRWRVVWRDLLTVKQDRDFETQAEAESFAEKVRQGDGSNEIADLSADDLEMALQFWMSLK